MGISLTNSQYNHYLDYVLPHLAVDLDSGLYTDLTLYSGDGHHRKVHKLVLSLCSPFTHHLLQLSSEDDSVSIFLPDIDAQTLDTFVQGIYDSKTSYEVPPGIVYAFCLRQHRREEKKEDIVEIKEESCEIRAIKRMTKKKTRVLRCKECCGCFRYKSSLLKHIMQQHPEASTTQYFKDLSEVVVNTLKTGRNVSQWKTDAMCTQCGKILSSHDKLRKHIQTIHEGLRPFACDKCGLTFAQMNALNSHILAIHEHPGLKPFQCDICHKFYSTQNNLKKHRLMLHVKIEVCRCSVCDKGFVTIGEMKRHVRRVHNKERKYLCTMCPKSFFVPSRLQNHMNIHNGVKPYVCEICNHSFHAKDHLRLHRIGVHSEKRKLSCHICGRMFGRKNRLTTHMKSH